MSVAHLRQARGDVGGLVLGLALFALLLVFGWVGFIGSDDVTYARGAYGWLESFPYVGGHGTIRYPITIPMALSFRLFGENEVAMVLPSLLYVVAFLVGVWFAVRSVAGPRAALFALGALVTSPLIVVQSTIAGVDVIEMAFLFASVLLFWRCLDRGPEPRLLLASGAFAGLAFLTRETALFVVPFYGLLFLVGHRFARRHYLWIAAGFLAVWGLELIYLGIMTGDPLYRFNISLNHDSSIDRSIDVAGNLIVHPVIDPLLVLLFNQEVMLLFYLAVPLTFWLCISRRVDPRVRHFARILALFGAVWVVCIGAAQTLLPLNPRYFMISCAVACILTGIALAQLLGGTRTQRRGAMIAAAGLLAGNLIGIYVENKESLFAERLLARILNEGSGVIHTDPMTRYRADMLLQWSGARERVEARPPVVGDVYLYNPAHASSANSRMPATIAPAYLPSPQWVVMSVHEPSPTFAAKMIEALGLKPVVPDAAWQKLRYRHPPVTIYKIR